MVLPEPAGAESSVSGPCKPACSRATSRGRGTRLGRAGGKYNLVVSRGMLIINPIALPDNNSKS